MSKKRLIATVIGVFLAVTLNTTYAFEAFYGDTELNYYDKTKAYKGYTLFRPYSGPLSYLVDMEGNVINTWPSNVQNPQLLENGSLFGRSSKDVYTGVVERNWAGDIVWEHYEKRENYHPHHDHVRTFNPKLNAYTTMYIANKDLTHEECIDAGCDPSLSRDYSSAQMDTIVEVDMNGNIVWEWRFIDHVVQDIDPTKKNYVGKGKTIADYPGRLNLNWGSPVKRDWLHCNSMDYNKDLDQCVINSVDGEFYVVDHGNTFIPGDPEGSMALAAGPAGDFIYRWGDPARYNQGDKPFIPRVWRQISNGHKQIGGAHDIQWIRPGLPGAGHLLIFNNKCFVYEETMQSQILEINPFLDISGKDTGNYVNPPEAGYHDSNFDSKSKKTRRQQRSNHVVWMFESKSNQSFYSQVNGGCQRLPNGNTLVCASVNGHFFEVTPEGEVVWEYINPVTADGIKKIIGDSPPQYNNSFRCYRYGPDFPGLKGKDLRPKGTITELVDRGEIQQFKAQPRRARKRR